MPLSASKRGRIAVKSPESFVEVVEASVTNGFSCASAALAKRSSAADSQRGMGRALLDPELDGDVEVVGVVVRDRARGRLGHLAQIRALEPVVVARLELEPGAGRPGEAQLDVGAEAVPAVAGGVAQAR